MRYYVITDVHGFYMLTRKALEEKGFFDEEKPCKLIICGDILDRGLEKAEMQEFILELLRQDKVILIRGNHEDLLECMLDDLLYGDLYPFEKGTSYHIRNGTWQTALSLSGFTASYALAHTKELVARIKASDFYKKILPEAVNFYETDNYIFVHGYIPMSCPDGDTVYRINKKLVYNSNWRNASAQDWQNARWYNGMELACKRHLTEEGKTIVCGHANCTYGHSEIDQKCSMYGADAIHEPYYGKGIIALDAGTSITKRVNCIIIDD